MSETPPPAGPPGPPQGGPPPYPQQQPPPYGQQPYGAAPQYPPPGPGLPYGAPPGPKQGTNGLAIASLIFGVIGGILLSVIFGIVALGQIKKRNQGGRGLAIAGLILSGLWVALIGVGVIVAIATDAGEPDRDASGQVTETTNVRPDKLKTGDCVESLDLGGDEIKNLKLVPCSGPNGGEVYATFELPAGKWPGLSAVQKDADKGCGERWDALKREAEKESDIIYLHPTDTSWSLGDRGVTCLVVPTK